MEKWYKGVYRRQLTDMHIHDEDDRFLSEFNADEYYENLVRAKIQSPMIYLQSHTLPPQAKHLIPKFISNLKRQQD